MASFRSFLWLRRFHRVYGPHLLYPCICRRTFRLFPHVGYCVTFYLWLFLRLSCCITKCPPKLNDLTDIISIFCGWTGLSRADLLLQVMSAEAAPGGANMGWVPGAGSGCWLSAVTQEGGLEAPGPRKGGSKAGTWSLGLSAGRGAAWPRPAPVRPPLHGGVQEHASVFNLHCGRYIVP